MSLHTRILLGTLPLLLLTAALGGYAVWLFARLGGAVNTTLRENYASVAAMHDLREAALGIDHALALERAGAASPAQTSATVASLATLCRRDAALETGNVTEPGERELATRLGTSAEAFLTAATAAAAASQPASESEPPLAALLDAASVIRELNEHAMRAKDHRARAAADTSTRVMLLALLATLPIGALVAFQISRAIRSPLVTLTESARELGEGNLDQVLPVTSHDELGRLADAFNKMAGSLRVYRQSTSDELVHARQATEIVFAALLDPIVIFSSEGEIVYQNPAAGRLRKKLAASETTLPIVPLAMSVLNGNGDFLPESFDQSICVRVDDREKFLLPRVIGLRDGGAGAVVILNDVTRFRLLDDVKTNLVATVSHELKTPLTSIRMAVYLLLEERIGALNPKQAELLLASRDDAERLLDLINNLLDLAKLESGASVSERRAQRPDDLIQHAAADSREFAASAGASLVIETEPNLPPVAVSSDQLRHVFSNLISNAVKHSPAGEEITLAARSEEGGRAVRFSVIDRGPGVPASERERIFEKFYRLPGEPKEGAGLGLAICREIVRAHDGRIGVLPAPAGTGSEFYFVLPTVV